MEFASRSFTGLQQPAAAIEKVQDGLPDSRVWLNSCIDPGHLSNYRPKQPTGSGVKDSTGLPPAASFGKLHLVARNAPSSRYCKQLPTDQQGVADALRDKAARQHALDT